MKNWIWWCLHFKRGCCCLRGSLNELCLLWNDTETIFGSDPSFEGMPAMSTLLCWWSSVSRRADHSFLAFRTLIEECFHCLKCKLHAVSVVGGLPLEWWLVHCSAKHNFEWAERCEFWTFFGVCALLNFLIVLHFTLGESVVWKSTKLLGVHSCHFCECGLEIFSTGEKTALCDAIHSWTKCPPYCCHYIGFWAAC